MTHLRQGYGGQVLWRAAILSTLRPSGSNRADAAAGNNRRPDHRLASGWELCQRPFRASGAHRGRVAAASGHVFRRRAQRLHARRPSIRLCLGRGRGHQRTRHSRDRNACKRSTRRGDGAYEERGLHRDRGRRGGAGDNHRDRCQRFVRSGSDPRPVPRPRRRRASEADRVRQRKHPARGGRRGGRQREHDGRDADAESRGAEDSSARCARPTRSACSPSTTTSSRWRGARSIPRCV